LKMVLGTHHGVDRKWGFQRGMGEQAWSLRHLLALK
jgi:hypothetical protein